MYAKLLLTNAQDQCAAWWRRQLCSTQCTSQHML